MFSNEKLNPTPRHSFLDTKFMVILSIPWNQGRGHTCIGLSSAKLNLPGAKGKGEKKIKELHEVEFQIPDYLGMRIE